MKSVTSSRVAAYRALISVERDGAYANLALRNALSKLRLSPRDRRLATEIVYGTLRWRKFLDWALLSVFDGKLSALSQELRTILRMGAYQILKLNRVPDYAAVDESVKLAKLVCPERVPLVNAVLRRLVSGKEKIRFPDSSGDPVRYLSVVYSHPKWLVRRWIKNFGLKDAEMLLKFDNVPPETVIRVNSVKATPEELAKRLEAEGFSSVKSPVFPGFALRVKGEDAEISIVRTESFREGLFAVQDEGAMLPVIALDPKPGERVLDACAGPGGKTTFLAERVYPNGEVFAVEIHRHRAELIRKNVLRMGLSGVVKVFEGDVRKFDPNVLFDKILVDVPCSGTGVLRRRPDLRWRKTERVLPEMAKLQREILEAVAKLLKPGGALVYCSCSLEPEENWDVVNDFLKTHSDFEIGDISPYVPEGWKANVVLGSMIQLLPHVHGVDGMFVAKLVKVR